jgi:hypothetical protein
MEPLTTRLEDAYRSRRNEASLRGLHAAGDWNGLLEYALLLAELEAHGRIKVDWMARDAMKAPMMPLNDEHLRWARELLGELA